MERIKAVTVVTAQGVNTYRVDSKTIGFERFIVDKITMEARHINGDPYDHFCIYDVDGELRTTINCLVPCEVEYGA